MDRKEVGIASVCQGGITYLPRRRALRNSSERERPHAETLPANLSLLPSLEAPTSSWLGRAGAVLGLETFMGCSSPARAAQPCLGVTSLTGWWSPACHDPTLMPQAAPRCTAQGF